jgi:hypothetical protein
MSKQTAVEWLVKSLIDVGLDYPLGQHIDLIVQAIKMEREQIEDAYGDGLNAHRTNFCDREQYYNETYKRGEHES